ncbi:MAG: glutathione S-transferase family protein [Parvularculaceae bacterium]
MITIIGSPISPYVKKVLTLLVMKGVAFEVDPITPFYGDDRFTKLSPLRRIPVLIDGDVVLNDSSVIAQYIEERWPEPSALPDTPAARAKARWLEEYSDSRIGEIFIWRGFGPMIVAPRVFGTEPDKDAFRKNIETGVREVMDYLESVASSDGFLAGAFGLADVSVASMFRNIRYAGWKPDAATWPKTCAWLARAEAQAPLALANQWSDALVKVGTAERRRVAADLGLTLTAETYGLDTPRRAAMSQL